MADYDIGDTRNLSVTFSVGGSLTDPTTVTFKMKEPDGTETTYVFGTDPELTNPSTGVYTVSWPITQSGIHRYKFVATGTVEQAEQLTFLAREDGTA